MKQSSLHAAIIMDGNGRWASRKGLPRVEGHRVGAESLRAIVETAPRLNIGTLTVYAFSADNWRRPPEEVTMVMYLLTTYLEKESMRLRDAGVKTSVIGRRDRLPSELLAAVNLAESCTQYCANLHFRLAIDYSSRAAILEAARTSRLEEHFFDDAPPVDLLVRTGGEQRLSDFLLWESAYAELVFTDRMWPEFSPADLRDAVREFHRRDRRFGGATELLLATPPVELTERWLR